MLFFYILIATLSRIVNENRTKIADQLFAIGTASYVAGILELIKLEFTVDAALLIIVGLVFTYLASKIRK